MKSPPLLVAAGVLIEAGRLLLSQRRAGTHLAGAWEFPGGKVEPGEDPRDALVREFEEEVGVQVRVDGIIEVTFHRYSERDVLLLFYSVARVNGTPEPREVAAIRWAGRNDVRPEDFPPADLDVLQKVLPRLGT